MQGFFFFFGVKQRLDLRSCNISAIPDNKGVLLKNLARLRLLGRLGSQIIMTTKHEHLLDRLGLGSLIMTTINVHLPVKHGVTHINAEDCYSQEPSPTLHGQSSLSQPWSQWPQYNESSIGVTFTILNRYLQVISSPSLIDK